MDLGLENKVAFVAASSAGLGRAVAEALAGEGARVAICGRDAGRLRQAAEEIRSLTKAEILALQGDVTSEECLASMVASVLAEWGTIHILVNNAGGPPAGVFENLDLEAWRDAVRLSFLSAVSASRLVLPCMKRQKWGRIINITSISVKQPVDGLILSNAVRSAVVGLGKSLANELAAHGILVNNVCPGYTRTRRVLELAEARASKEGRSAAQILAEWEKTIPLGRLGEPVEFASLVAFLASERAGYITGTTIQVDGGYVKGVF